MAYKGRYTVKNPKKYKGDVTKVIYRSLWERSVMKYLDNNPNVKEWSSEEIAISYVNPWDHRKHLYYPDFWARILNPNGEIETVIIEVKPDKQCREPKVPKRRTKNYYRERAIWGINKAKWLAAINLCEQKGWKFQVLTEKNILSG